jgi:hypothetical protein
LNTLYLTSPCDPAKAEAVKEIVGTVPSLPRLERLRILFNAHLEREQIMGVIRCVADITAQVPPPLEEVMLYFRRGAPVPDWREILTTRFSSTIPVSIVVLENSVPPLCAALKASTLTKINLSLEGTTLPSVYAILEAVQENPVLVRFELHFGLEHTRGVHGDRGSNLDDLLGNNSTLEHFNFGLFPFDDDNDEQMDVELKNLRLELIKRAIQGLRRNRHLAVLEVFPDRLSRLRCHAKRAKILWRCFEIGTALCRELRAFGTSRTTTRTRSTISCC